MISELFVLSKNYPIIAVIIAAILFIIGFRIAKKIMWALGIIALIIAILLLFL